jgi:hypothetical protein
MSNVAAATTNKCLQTLPTATATPAATAATGTYQWSRRFGGIGHDWGAAIAIDRRANCDSLGGSNCVVVAGYLYGTVDFGPGCGPRAAAGALGDDLFVAKYSAAGQCLWSNVYGGTSSDRANAVAVDPTSGDVIVAGYSLSSSIDLGKGALSGFGMADIIIAKYNAAGQPQWSKRFGGTSTDMARGVTVDASGNVLVVGSFLYTVDFSGTGATGARVTAYGSTDAFLAKYQSNGTFISVTDFNGFGQDSANAVAVDPASGDVLIAGFFAGNYNIGGGQVLTANGMADIVVARFSSSGQYRFSRDIGGQDSDEADALTIDADGDVVVTGIFRGLVDFGDATWNANSSGAGFVVKLDASLGTTRWSHMIGGATGMSDARGVVTDGSRNVVVTGVYRGTTAYPANIGGVSVVSAGDSDIYVVKYSTAGAGLWTKRYGGTLTDGGTNVVVDASNNVLVTGYFADIVNFGGGSVTSAGGVDTFLLKLTP